LQNSSADTSNYLRAFQEAMKKGAEVIRLHDIRHFRKEFARITLKYRAGMPIASLSKDDGNWQPVNAKGIWWMPNKNHPQHGCCAKKTPRKGFLKERVSLW
jgi:hypothetical protein